MDLGDPRWKPQSTIEDVWLTLDQSLILSWPTSQGNSCKDNLVYARAECFLEIE